MARQNRNEYQTFKISEFWQTRDSGIYLKRLAISVVLREELRQ